MNLLYGESDPDRAALHDPILLDLAARGLRVDTLAYGHCCKPQFRDLLARLRASMTENPTLEAVARHHVDLVRRLTGGLPQDGRRNAGQKTG